MENVSVMIKPVSGRCVLNCRYCFYAEECGERAVPSRGIMSPVTAENTVRKFISFAGKSVGFMFQGGEPTLAGIDYYRNFLALEKKYNTRGIEVYNSVQTNGFDVSEELLDFFIDNGFYIGVSIDGTRAIHEKYRGLSYDSALSTAGYLKKRGALFSVLTVITDEIAENASEIIKDYALKGFKSVQFIPCIAGSNGKSFLSEDKYAAFLVDSINTVASLPPEIRPRLRHTENLISRLNGGCAENCAERGFCRVMFTLEADGSVYPCDFYCTDAYLLGNINSSAPAGMLDCDKAKAFEAESHFIPDDCRNCDYYFLCRNGCRRERINGKNIHCGALKKYYGEVLRKK